LLVPIAKEVGSSLPGDHQNILIFITGLICSAGMGMPVSGFPNQTASVFSRLSGAIFAEHLTFLIVLFWSVI
jgi:phosphate transporter